LFFNEVVVIVVFVSVKVKLDELEFKIFWIFFSIFSPLYNHFNVNGSIDN